MVKLILCKVGWNTIGLSVNSTNFVLRGMPRFGTLRSETFASQAYTDSLSLSIGGNQQTGSVIGSLSGIINRMWYNPSQISETDFQTLYSYLSKNAFYCK